jgi:hypothetical protein
MEAFDQHVVEIVNVKPTEGAGRDDVSFIFGESASMWQVIPKVSHEQGP